MKKLKLLAMLGAFGGVLLFGTGCNQTEQPIDEKYTGTFSNIHHGSMKVTTTTISSKNGVVLPTCVIDGVEKETSNYFIRWDPVDFNYYSNQKYDFTADVRAGDVDGYTTYLKGKTKFTGQFSENKYTYDVSLVYKDGGSLIDKDGILFSMNKPATSSVAVYRNSVDEDTYTYDMNPSDDNNETDLLEENNITVSGNSESHDSVDDDTHSYDVNPSDADSAASL